MGNKNENILQNNILWYNIKGVYVILGIIGLGYKGIEILTELEV